MVAAGRSTIAPDALALDRRGMAELFGGDLDVARVAEVPRVAVIVTAALRQRHDVIDDGGQRGQTLGIAVLAKAIGARQPQLALLLPGPAPEPLNHAHAL